MTARSQAGRHAWPHLLIGPGNPEAVRGWNLAERVFS
jgi:hypothetical protein